jgi:hypothetical protein
MRKVILDCRGTQRLIAPCPFHNVRHNLSGLRFHEITGTGQFAGTFKFKGGSHCLITVGAFRGTKNQSTVRATKGSVPKLRLRTAVNTCHVTC